MEATAGAARRIGMFYNQEADAVSSVGGQFARGISSAINDAGSAAVKYEDHREISAGASDSAKLLDGLTQQWNETIKNADPNDPSVAAKFRETVMEPALQKFADGFNTENSQHFAETKIDSIRDHFFQKTAADMSTMAGIAVHKNINDATTAMSNTAITDPSSVPTLLKGLDHSVGAMVDSSPTLSPADAARVKNEVSSATKKAIVQAGAIGAIQKSSSPEATADEWIKKYPEYISGAEAKTLAGNARQQIRANNYDTEFARRRQKEVATDNSNAAVDQYLVDVRSQDPKLANDPTAKKILNDPTLLPAAKNNLLNYIDRQLKPETQSQLSQQTFVGLLRDLRAPDADPDSVMQKAWDARLMDPGKPGSMTEHDFNQIRQEIVARKTPEGAALERDRAQFFKQYTGMILGADAATYNPQVGSPKLYQAEVDARRMEATLRQKGLDPHLAYDPASEYFVGRNERLAKYQGSMQTDLQTRAESPGFMERWFGGSSAAAPAAQKSEGPPPVPFELRGVAALQYSKSRNMWRDQTSGKLYDASGKEAGK